jgi:nicotinamidase-related amidase
MRISRPESLAIMIDIQERLFPHMLEKDQLEQSSIKLIQGLRALEVPILFTQQYTRGLGDTIDSVKDALFTATEAAEIGTSSISGPIEKVAFSCCGSAPFMEELQSRQPKFVVLFGIEAHVCVLQTALDLQEAGYLPVVVEDCISSRKLNDKKIALKRLALEGIRITTCESLLFELCESADAKEFKSISRIVK